MTHFITVALATYGAARLISVSVTSQTARDFYRWILLHPWLSLEGLVIRIQIELEALGDWQFERRKNRSVHRTLNQVRSDVYSLQPVHVKLIENLKPSSSIYDWEQEENQFKRVS